MSGGPNAESGHAPQPAAPDDVAVQIARHFMRARDRLGNTTRAIQGLLDAGVIVAGPAVTGRIEEAE